MFANITCEGLLDGVGPYFVILNPTEFEMREVPVVWLVTFHFPVSAEAVDSFGEGHLYDVYAFGGRENQR